MCGSSVPSMSLSSGVAGDPFVSMHVVFTPSDVSISLGSSFIITLIGNGMRCGDCTFDPRPILFTSPSGAQGSVRITSLVMTVTLSSGLFPAGTVISFVLSGVQNPAFPQPAIYNLKAVLKSSSNEITCRSNVGTFPSISAGDLSSATAPKIELSSVIAGRSGVVMTVSMTPVSLNVSFGRILITLVGEGWLLS